MNAAEFRAALAWPKKSKTGKTIQPHVLAPPPLLSFRFRMQAVPENRIAFQSNAVKS